MPETFAQFLEKWLRHSTVQGLNNPLVKMPAKRFCLLEPVKFDSVRNGGTLTIGTMSDPISRNLYKNYQTHPGNRGHIQ
jgi:hypothetical protein